MDAWQLKKANMEICRPPNVLGVVECLTVLHKQRIFEPHQIFYKTHQDGHAHSNDDIE
jgi:hypothetical protein